MLYGDCIGALLVAEPDYWLRAGGNGPTRRSVDGRGTRFDGLQGEFD